MGPFLAALVRDLGTAFMPIRGLAPGGGAHRDISISYHIIHVYELI